MEKLLDSKGLAMHKRTLYQIREYKAPHAYSTPLGVKLRTKWRSVKLIARLTLAGHRDIVLVPFHVNFKG